MLPRQRHVGQRRPGGTRGGGEVVVLEPDLGLGNAGQRVRRRRVRGRRQPVAGRHVEPRVAQVAHQRAGVVGRRPEAVAGTEDRLVVDSEREAQPELELDALVADRAREARRGAEVVGARRGRHESSVAAHAQPGDRVVRPPRRHPEVVLDLCDQLVGEEAAPLRLAATPAVPRVDVEAASRLGHDDDRRQPVRDPLDVPLLDPRPRRVVIAGAVQQEEHGEAAAPVIPVGQQHLRAQVAVDVLGRRVDLRQLRCRARRRRQHRERHHAAHQNPGHGTER